MKRLITSPAFMAIFSVIAAGLIAVYVYLYQTSQNTSSSASVVVPQVKIGGSFSLTNHLGQPVSDQDFLGKYMLVYFGYSYCPDVCPTDLVVIGENMLILEDQNSTLADKITPIFVTVDPERDKPAEMASYVANFHPRMVGLTGDLESIKDVAKAYRVYFSKGDVDEDGDYVMNHSAFTYLMGPQGEYVTMFKHGTDGPGMAAEIISLLD